MRLEEIAQQIGAAVEGDGAVEIERLAPIDVAGAGDLSFVANAKYRRLLATSEASAIIVGPGEETGDRTVLRADEPYGAFVRALHVFDRRARPEPGIHPTAVIADSAEVGEGAYVGPFAVVADRVVLGPDARIHPHVVLYPDVRAGARFTAHAGSVVRESVRIGDDVVLQPGVVVGADGFGFLPQGSGRPIPIPQVGDVELGDAVEVGANSTVDRAAIGSTVLSAGVKLDNLVMVAHGCRIGAGTMLAGQTGLAGSTILGSGILSGGQVGFAGHITVGDGVQIAGGSGVTRDIEAGKVVAGTPVQEISSWRRGVAALRSLPELIRRVRRLEQRLDSATGEG